jgi:hypothetical protein
MAAKSRVPIEKGQMPPENYVFREFDGLNTQAARQAIKPTQFFWLEGVMPVGFGNLKTVPQKSAALATLTGETPYYSKNYNISNTQYMFYACQSGAAYQVRVSDGAKTTIAVAGTFSGNAVQIAQWKNERILIIDTSGYYDWNGTTLTNDSGVSGAPSNGSCIATFANLVWIITGTTNRTIAWSNTNAYNDFTGAGGSTTINDETLISAITQLLPANNFLYVFGIDSINIIADVQVVSGVLQFSNTNISANSGSDLPQTIVPYYRAIWYMNETGVYALYGATPRKASDELDGIFPLIDFTKPVTGGTATIFNILCVCFMFTYNDPVQGARKLIALYFNKKWFLASQTGSLTIMATSNGTADLLLGVSGSSVYKLFSDTTSNITQKIISPFWDFNEYISIKQSIMIGMEGTLPAAASSVVITWDSELGSESPDTPFADFSTFQWFNSVGAPFTWTNSLGATFTWLAAGYIWFQSGIQNYGHYAGFTVTSSTAANVYNGWQLQYVKMPVGWGS